MMDQGQHERVRDEQLWDEWMEVLDCKGRPLVG